MDADLMIFEMGTERIPFIDQVMDLIRLTPETSVQHGAFRQVALEYLERYMHPAVHVAGRSGVADGEEGQ